MNTEVRGAKITRSPYFKTSAEARRWLLWQPQAAGIVLTSVYQTRKLRRWRASWVPLTEQPVFSRDAIALVGAAR